VNEPTPMMRQYQELKARHPGCLLLFRLGDFFELFGDDAVVASQELDLVLTTRDGEVPMCGVPHHALEAYLGRLMEKGYRVALAEQMEDPRLAKGLVRRDVIRVVTPSTWVEGTGSGPSSLVALVDEGAVSALAMADPATGRFLLRQFEGPQAHAEALREALRQEPAEWLAGPGWTEEKIGELAPVARPGRPTAEGLPAAPEGAGPAARKAAALLLDYLGEAHPGAASFLEAPVLGESDATMEIDPGTWRHLEIDRRQDGGRGRGTLLHVLDASVTAPGKRCLRAWLAEPFAAPGPIRARQDMVEAFYADQIARTKVAKALTTFRDVERTLARAAVGVGTPQDLLALATSLEAATEVAGVLLTMTEPGLLDVASRLAPPPDLGGAIRHTLRADLPPNWREGGFIRDGVRPELDRLRRLTGGMQDYLVALEAEARAATGIRTLKVGYNKVFGYYIEVTKPHVHLVPGNWERRQTLTSAERFVTPELKAREAEALTADAEAIRIEMEMLGEITGLALSERDTLRRVARAVGEIDALRSLAEVARRHRWVRPTVTAGEGLVIEEGRHPIVEEAQGTFVPNTLSLDGEARLLVITGPNMAGKSTFLRQAGLIVILAQMGSFVPAARAEIGIVDRLFSRIGASDDLAGGRSTFMVEMHEVAGILDRATKGSLVLLDEIGRGTSTFDGIALAWAIAEDLHDRLGCRTLLATHYLELAELEDILPRAKNVSVAVAEEDDEVVFLRQVVPGPADRSYGIHVARLAGVPHPVIARARHILGTLERGALSRRETAVGQLSFTLHEPGPLPPGGEEVLKTLARTDPNDLAPRQALEMLFRLRALLEDE